LPAAAVELSSWIIETTKLVLEFCALGNEFERRTMIDVVILEVLRITKAYKV
jgi:hypothetical protein